MKITKKKIQTASDYRTFDAYTPEEIDEMFPDWKTWASKEEIHDAELVYLPKSEENPYIGIKYPDGEIWVCGAGRDAKVSFEELCDYMAEGSGVEATVSVKCATSLEMLDAFETRLNELNGVDASCKVEAATNYGRETEIYGEDYNTKYEDTGAAFGGDGTEIYTLAEIKEYWNEFNETDSVLAEYPSFEMWWQDTRDNFMSEYHWD